MCKKLRKSTFFSSFFLPMDPDSKSGSTQVIESGSNTDPDPQPWIPQFYGATGNAEGNHSDGRKLFMHFWYLELVFTELILQILHWIYKSVIHSRIFIVLWNLHYLFLAGNWVVPIVCLTVEKMRECLKTKDLWWTTNTRRIPRKKGGNLLAKIYTI
jgi:hypothetical protein